MCLNQRISLLASRLSYRVILFASAAGAVILGCCCAWLATLEGGLPMEWPQ